MEASEIAQFARNFSVLVRVQGPDPKGLKMRRNSFHIHQSGKTTISASGLLLPASSLCEIPTILEHVMNIHQFSGAVVVTVASVVHPFLVVEHRNKPTQEFSPKLIHDACIDVLVEGKVPSYDHQEPDATPEWLSAKLLALVDVPTASDALLSLIGGQTSWEASWSLSSFNSSQTLVLDGLKEKVGHNFFSRKDIALEEFDNPVILARLATRIAVLGISIPDKKDGPSITVSQQQSRGDLIIVMGSPFGVLSPMHFYNSISVGNLANCSSSGSNKGALLVADIRCLPGMEGGPVFDRHACLAGILTKPIRQKGSNAEIQLAVSWNAIVSIDNECLQLEACKTHNGLLGRTKCNNHMVSSYECADSGLYKKFIRSPVTCSHISSLERAISSVVLIAVGEGSWASGIVLNNCGLILTNAHILEPWRFGKTSQLGSIVKTTSHNELETPLGPQSSIRISVRLDFMEQKKWYNARAVFVSKGPLDVALLQLETVPPHLFPIIPQLACSSEGTIVHVIGHGLLGPRSNISSSVSSGVLSKIVEIPVPNHVYGSNKSEKRKLSCPIMLQTTAAVHPGASGGAVVNSKGHMVGLVTSNARHGGATIIPHLNFSIPCAALEPVFKFSETQDASILEILDKPNELQSSVWALVSTESKKQVPELKNKYNSEGKGSRFSKFLEEKNAEITGLKELHHLKGLPSKI